MHAPVPAETQLALLKARIDVLPRPQRQVVELRYRRNLRVPEMAALLGWTDGEVTVQLKRALKSLGVTA